MNKKISKKNKLKLASMIFAASFFFVQISQAAPSVAGVSGEIKHNSQTTISGSGFGSKAQAAPFLWDSVENISAYNNLKNRDNIPVGTGYPWASFVGGVPFTMALTEDRAGGKAYKAINTTKGGFDGRPLPEDNPSHLYVSWWWKPSADPNLPSGEHSSKFIRIANKQDPQNKTSSWTQMQCIVYENPNPLANAWAKYPGNVNQWNFHEVWFDNINRRFNIKVNN
jgi:hypothetical protein